MKRSQNRILTTHVGSLVRPPEVVDVLQRKADGQPFTEGERALVDRHVAAAVRMQAECGIDIPSDGEYSKTGFSQYITDRLTGFELRTDLPGRGGGTARSRDRRRFPDAYREIEGSPQNAPTSTGQPQLQMVHTVCTGPIAYRGQAAIQADIAAFKSALTPHRFEEAFIPAHTTDAPLREIAPVILQIKAGAFSLEAANPRHEHEYHVWEDLEFPKGKIIIPGVVAHTTNCVEHPELVAERIMRYAKMVGRENVIAGVDCGFAQGLATARVHPSIMWEKLRMLAEGARLASRRLWA